MMGRFTPGWNAVRRRDAQRIAARELPGSGPCLPVLAVAAGLAVLSPSGQARADVISDVNTALNQIITATSSSLVDGPPEVAREIAMVNTAMFDAVNAATGGQYAYYAYNGPVSGASVSAAALQAGYATLSNIFLDPGSPYQVYKGVVGTGPYSSQVVGPTVATMNAVAAIIAGLGTELAGFGGGSAVTAGVALGTASSAAIVAKQASDGAYNAIINGLSTYTPAGSGTTPGVYVPPGARPAMMPTWGSTVTPVGLSSTQMSGLVATVPTRPDVGSPTYAASLLETECLGGAVTVSGSLATTCAAAGFDPAVNRTTATSQSAPANLSTLTPDQISALYWNDPGTTLQPPGHWLDIADTVANSQGIDLLHHARTDALLGMAMDAAGAGAWEVKYTDPLWRPATALNWTDNAWNTAVILDPGWRSTIVTPPHPDYLAGHPTFSEAAAAVLDATLAVSGDTSFCSASGAYTNDGTLINGVSGTNNVGAITECFAASGGQTAFDLAAYEAGQSRIWGGIHTSLAVDASSALGTAVGQAVLSTDLQEVPEPATLALLAGGILLLTSLRGRAAFGAQRLGR